jgi:uncharacterized protein
MTQIINPDTWQDLGSGEHKLLIEGPAGHIEAIMSIPEQPVAQQVAVVCHPHPLHGGAMTNKVAHTLSKSLTSSGIINLRFNFRGVGRSQCTHDNGVGESEDLQFLAKLMTSSFNRTQLLLAGFSFGAWISIGVAKSVNCQHLISIAPPVKRFDFSQFEHPSCPWLIVMGEQDEVVEPEAVFEWVDELKPKPELWRYPDTTHFFHGKLVLLRDQLEAYLATYLAKNIASNAGSANTTGSNNV